VTKWLRVFGLIVAVLAIVCAVAFGGQPPVGGTVVTVTKHVAVDGVAVYVVWHHGSVVGVTR